MPEHRIFAAAYNAIFAGLEKAGLADKRRELLSQASGATLELGAGTGHNLEHYPEAVTRLVLTEPDPHMAKRLRAQVGESGRGGVEVVEAGAESLPFGDDEFDTAIATLVFCTIPDPEAALTAEAAEAEVRNREVAEAKVQNRLEPTARAPRRPFRRLR